jgi:regulation of enolase protein 1 (concanavalin A-like superfamily)
VGQVPAAGFDNIAFTRIGFSGTPFGTLVTAQASGDSSFDSQTSAAGINNLSANFTVFGPPPPPPLIASFTPSGAVRGGTVTVTGSHLGGATLIQIGAQTAPQFTVVDDQTVRFTVPPEAVDGRIRVTTAGGAAESANLLVVPENNEAPVITLGLPAAVSLPEGAGLMLSANATDDGLPGSPAALTTRWSVVNAPAGGDAVFDHADRLSTGVTFGTPGNYLLRLTADDGQLTSTADLTVAVGLPSSGVGQDIGSVGVAGSSSESQGVWTVRASGADIWETADGFHFRHAELRGDGFVQVRLLGQSNTDPWAKAGVMIRDSLTAGSAHALLAVTPANGLALQNRATTAAPSQHQALGAYDDGVWLRLVRSGTTITAFRSDDGATWTPVGQAVSPAMTDPVYLGLAVTSHNNGVLGTATFDHLQGSGFGAPALDIAAGDSVTAAAGATVTLAGRAPVSASTEWRQMSGPGTLVFADAGDLSTTVTSSSPGTYRVRLVADDGTVGTFQELLLTFAEDTPPEVRLHAVGLAVYDMTSGTTRVTHRLAGRAYESVAFEYTGDLGSPFRDHVSGGYPPKIQADSEGIYELTISEPGDKTALWNRRMFFRARWPAAD